MKSDITLPTRMSTDLAELIGIILGDGSISLKTNTLNNRLKISFNSKDDTDYIFYVKDLIKSLFNVDPILKYRKNENTADLFVFRKDIINYLVNDVGLRLSPKWNRAIIPKKLMSPNLNLMVLRGYFDTDGCLALVNNNGIIYPRLEMKICPSPMQKQFAQILKDNKFNFGAYDIGKGKIRIQLNGKLQLNRWSKLVGFSNEKHLNKLVTFLKVQ